MENDLMERLLTDFNGVLQEFNELVRNNDIEGVRKVLDEVNRLVQERDGITLDDREDPQYDHVLHEILDKMHGIVEREIVVDGIDGVPGSVYIPNEEVERMISEAEQEANELQRQINELRQAEEDNPNINNSEVYLPLMNRHQELLQRIADLRAAIVEGQEFSTLTRVDPRLAELQAERRALVEEKRRLEAEIAELEKAGAISEERADIERQLSEAREELRRNGERRNDPNVDYAIFRSENSRLTNLINDLEGRLRELDAEAATITETEVEGVPVSVIQERIDNLRREPTSEETSREGLLEGSRLLGESLTAIVVNNNQGYIAGEIESETDSKRVTSNDVDFQTAINGYNERISGLLARLANGENVREELNTAISEFDGYIDNFANDVARIRTINPNEELLNRFYDRQLDLLRQARASLGDRIETYDREVAERESSEINSLIANELESVLELADETGHVSIEDINARMEALRTEKEEIENSEERIPLTPEEIDAIDRQNAELTQDIQAASEQLQSLEARILELTEADTTELREELSGLLKQRTDLAERIKELKKQLKNAEKSGITPEERTDLERQLAEAREELRKNGERRNDPNVEYEYFRIEHSRLTELINDLEGRLKGSDVEAIRAEIESLQAEKAKLKGPIQSATNKLNRAKRDIILEQLNSKKARLETLDEGSEEYKKLLEEIEELTLLESYFQRGKGIKKELTDRISKNKRTIRENNDLKKKGKVSQELSPEKAKRIQVIDGTLVELDEISKQKETYKITTKSNSEKDQKAIDEKKKRIAEIDKRIKEIDEEISKIPGAVPPRTEKETLDVDAEARKIGDHIFKTARIRRELAERNVTRDEFLAFYQAGFDKTNEQIDQLGASFKRIRDEIKIVVVDSVGNSGKRLDVQIAEAEKDGNTELATQLYEQLRQNLIRAGREEQLKKLGLDHEVTSPEDAEKMKEFFAYYKTSATKALKDISDSVAELKENASIFATEITRIQAEKETLEMAGGSIDELEAKTAVRKDMRRKLLEASMTPEKDLTDEQKELLEKWQNASERFLGKKTTAKYVYINKDGKQVALDVDTIDDQYPEYSQDAEFLGVPAYKENLEQLSAYNQTQDPYVFGEEVGRAYEAAEAEREGAGQEVLAQIMADKQKYVETFNGIPNPHKVKYENWKTAGSTLKGMKPVSRDLPMATRAKNTLENVGRFLGIRAPKFTRLDEHGNEVSDVKGGAATLALDAVVVGAVVGSAVTIGPALAVAGYAAKGIVTLGNRIAARIEYSRHKDEIDGNLPILHQAGSDAREVARKEYYREQGDNRLVSWFKAKSDKYFTRKRAAETEKAIVENLASQYEQAEDERTAAIKENIELADINQKARLARQRQIAMGANTYNDIVRDPDAVDMDEATAAIARNAALEASKPGSGREDVNKGSQEARRSQYVKQEGPVAQTEDLNEIAEEVEGPVSAITLEQIYTGRKQHVDRWNKVLTAITAGAIKFGYTAWKDGLTRTETIHHDAETRTDTIHHDEQVIHHDAEYSEVTVNDTQVQYDTSKTLGELQQNYAGKTTTEYYSVSGGLRGARTEELVDKGITAGWFDDKSAWGTGISDTQGLSAPVLTDRIAQASLLDANGYIRPDVTVQEFLNAMGCSNPDLTSLDGIYMSVGDKYWVALSDLMKGMTKEVTIGSHTETQLIKDAWDQIVPAWDESVETVIKAAWDETITKVDPAIVAKAIKDGLLVGAGIGAVDALHEAAQNTYIDGATPGRPEETTPFAKYSFDDIADQLYEEAEYEKQEKAKQEEEARKAEEAKKKNNDPEREDEEGEDR